MFGMGNSPLSGTFMVKLGSHKLKSVYHVLSFPPKIQLYWDIQRKVQELRQPSAEGLSCSAVSGLVTAVLGNIRDTNSSRNNHRFK